MLGPYASKSGRRTEVPKSMFMGICILSVIVRVLEVLGKDHVVCIQVSYFAVPLTQVSYFAVPLTRIKTNEIDTAWVLYQLCFREPTSYPDKYRRIWLERAPISGCSIEDTAW